MRLCILRYAHCSESQLCHSETNPHWPIIIDSHESSLMTKFVLGRGLQPDSTVNLLWTVSVRYRKSCSVLRIDHLVPLAAVACDSVAEQIQRAPPVSEEVAADSRHYQCSMVLEDLETVDHTAPDANIACDSTADGVDDVAEREVSQEVADDSTCQNSTVQEHLAVLTSGTWTAVAQELLVNECLFVIFVA